MAAPDYTHYFHDRITSNRRVMGGQPCIRGTRMTAATVVALVASGTPTETILQEYPWLELEDIPAALRYAAWRLHEYEFVIPA